MGPRIARAFCDLQDELDESQSRLPFHLRVLKEAGLIADRREGRFIHYHVIPDALAEAHDAGNG